LDSIDILSDDLHHKTAEEPNFIFIININFGITDNHNAHLSNGVVMKLNIISSMMNMAMTVASVESANIEIVEWGLNKNRFKPGDTAQATFTLKNNGNKAVKNGKVKASIQKKVPIAGFIKVMEKEMDISELIKGFQIKPGETKKFSTDRMKVPDIPMVGGEYKYTAIIIIDGKEIKKLEGNITIEK
jgi:hypothetical protein